MKTLNREVSLLMYFMTDVLSVQKTESKRSIFNSFLDSISMQLAIVAAITSILEMIMHFYETTQAFPITKALCCQNF